MTSTALPALPRRRRRGRRAGAPRGLLIGGLVAAALSLVPIVFLALEARGVSASEAQRLLLRPRVGDLLANTVGLIVATTALCAVIGVGAAWCIERTNVPGRRVWM